MNFKKFSLGLVAGTIGGAIYGLLTTKNSGQVNRNRLELYVNDVKEKAGLVGEDLSRLADNVDQLQKVGIPKANKFKNEVDLVVKDFQKEVEPRQRRIQGHVQNIQDEAESFQKKAQSNVQTN